MQNSPSSGNIILALDVPDRDSAFDLLASCGPELGWVKIGLQLFVRYGPDFVKEVADKGYKIFLDLKLHDIPNTVASAIRSVKDLPIDLFTVHAGGGREMLEWALEAIAENPNNPQLLAVTILTSFSESGLSETGLTGPIENHVLNLARMAVDAGVPGLVASPKELTLLRKELGPDPLLVIPGIRPKGSDANEQKRTLTPPEATALGANHLVIGRPISRAEDPRAAIAAIKQSIQEASSHAG